jgi:hypothetical protein
VVFPRFEGIAATQTHSDAAYGSGSIAEEAGVVNCSREDEG